MENLSAVALGESIRSLRLAAGISQSELARLAGYGAGGEVSISRIENGAARPSPARFVAIAEALGTSPEALEGAARAAGLGSGAGGATRTTRARIEDLQAALSRRAEVLDRHTSRLNSAHEAAGVNFMAPLIAATARIHGAPEPPAPKAVAPVGRESEQVAEAQIDAARFGVDSALWAGSLGANGDGSDAAVNASVALTKLLLGVSAFRSIGGLGATGGGLFLGGLAALPAVAAAISGFALLSRRNKAKNAELERNLEIAESQLASTEHGFSALLTALEGASGVLEHIDLHGGRALSRWERELPAGPSRWESLGEPGQQEVRRFVRLAACYVAMSTINFELFLTLREDTGREHPEGESFDLNLSRFTEEVEQLIAAARRTVEELV